MEAAVRVQERAARKEVVLSGAFDKVMESSAYHMLRNNPWLASK